MIEFRHVYLKYIPDFFSLFDANFIFDTHTLILGDDISGSRAILRLISKLDCDYSGEIFLDGKNLSEIKDRDLPLSYVPKEPALFENKSIFFNLFYPLKIRKINKSIAEEKIKSCLNQFSLSDTLPLNLKVKKLSASLKKIVMLIRARVRAPKYLLLDEFFSSLEPEYHPLAQKIISSFKTISTIIACEENPISCYSDFEILDLNQN